VVGAPDDQLEESSDDDEDEDEPLPVPDEELPVSDDDAPLDPEVDEVDVDEGVFAETAPSAGSWPACTRSASTLKTATIEASAAAAKRRREGARSMQRRLRPAAQGRLNRA
jgi:hypothetical protein